MSIGLLQQASQGQTYLKKGREGLSAIQKYQNKATKLKT